MFLYNASVSLGSYLEPIRTRAGAVGAADGQRIHSIRFNADWLRIAALQAGVEKFLAVFIGQTPGDRIVSGRRLRNGERQGLSRGGSEVINILFAW